VFLIKMNYIIYVRNYDERIWLLIGLQREALLTFVTAAGKRGCCVLFL